MKMNRLDHTRKNGRPQGGGKHFHAQEEEMNHQGKEHKGGERGKKPEEFKRKLKKFQKQGTKARPRNYNEMLGKRMEEKNPLRGKKPTLKKKKKGGFEIIPCKRKEKKQKGLSPPGTVLDGVTIQSQRWEVENKKKVIRNPANLYRRNEKQK